MAAQKHESKYKKEDNWGELKECQLSEHKGGKASSRPAAFCKPVTCLDTLSVAGATTILPPAITVGGITYVPTEVMVVVTPGSVGLGGVAIPATYATINVLAAQS
jgi:hypothetical protein